MLSFDERRFPWPGRDAVEHLAIKAEPRREIIEIERASAEPLRHGRNAVAGRPLSYCVESYIRFKSRGGPMAYAESHGGIYPLLRSCL